MALYTITYDLRNNRDYKTLYEELEAFNAVKILESTWCFKRDKTTSPNLRDYFGKLTDSDDGIFICEVKAWASRKTDGTPKAL